MKIALTAAAALVLPLGCGGAQSAQPPSPPPAAAAPATPAPPPRIVGGYAPGDVASDEARDQAAAAIELLRTRQHDASIQLVAIRAFAKQIVAGTNYRLALDVTTSAGAHQVALVMFLGLDHQRSIRDVSGF